MDGGLQVTIYTMGVGVSIQTARWRGGILNELVNLQSGHTSVLVI